MGILETLMQLREAADPNIQLQKKRAESISNIIGHPSIPALMESKEGLRFNLPESPGSGLLGSIENISPQQSALAQLAKTPGSEDRGLTALLNTMSPQQKGNPFTNQQLIGDTMLGFNENTQQVDVIPQSQEAKLTLKRNNMNKLADIDTKRVSELMKQAKADRKSIFDMEKTMRSEYTQVTKTFANVNDSFDRIEASRQDPSPAGDLALIFNYMKMLDPDSVVRESEFATAAASGSFGDRIQAAALKIAKGERLSSQQRKDFADRSTRLFKAAAKSHNKRVKEFRRIAVNNKLNPDNVIFNRQVSEIPPDQLSNNSTAQNSTSTRLKFDPKTGIIQ